MILHALEKRVATSVSDVFFLSNSRLIENERDRVICTLEGLRNANWYIRSWNTRERKREYESGIGREENETRVFHG